MKSKKSIFKVLASAGIIALASVGAASVEAAPAGFDPSQGGFGGEGQQQGGQQQGGSSTNSSYKGKKYYTAFATEDEAVAAAVELQTRIAAEGDVLLKNKDKALPLKSNAKISVFGGRQNNVLGASKSSGGMSSGSGGIGLASALSESGFQVNPTLAEYYENNATSIGEEASSFNGRVESSLGFYSDAAVIILSREGGEGSDASRVTSEATDTDDFEHQALYSDGTKTYKHYLMLTNKEEALIKYVKEHFNKVVVVINSSNAMELSKLQEDKGISAIITIGRPGEGGMYGLAQILNGTVSPSGSVVDEWMTDFTTDPTWYNFGSQNQTGTNNNYYYADWANVQTVTYKAATTKDGVTTPAKLVDASTKVEINFAITNETKVIGADGKESALSAQKDGATLYLYKGSLYTSNKWLTGVSGSSTAHDSEGYHGVDYEEGIYLGYKYYETVYSEIAEGNIAYDSTKPLGQQLSYNDVSTGKTPANIESANRWWERNVTYAYGSGLTYSSFSFNIAGVYEKEDLSVELTSAGLADRVKSSVGHEAETKTIYAKVTVKNTGHVAGKKTVQLYVTAPYEKGGVEKAFVSLVGFGKTSVLQPGESEDIVVAINMQDIASYDYKNLSGAVGTDGGYVLEKGEYTLRAMDTSHFDYNTDLTATDDAYAEFKFELDKSVELGLDDYSGNEVHNLFTDNGIGTGEYMADDATTTDIISGTGVTEEDMHDVKYNSVRTADMMADGTSGMTILSRANMVATFPEAPTKADHSFKNSVLNYFAYWDTFRVSTEYKIDGNGFESDTKVRDASHDYESDPWYIRADQIPAGWTQAAGVYDAQHRLNYNRTTITYPMYVSQAKDITLKFADMAGVPYDDAKWDTFLNQLTYDELCTVVEFGGYCTVDIQSVGKLKHADTDGPNNLDGTVAWTSEDILAGTFNTELAYEEGVVMANIGLLHGVQGWYGPGADTHRSPFSGRNNEYYSQDGLHAGYMGAAEVQGVQAMGVIPYIKHCLMNDMETDRGTMFVWADEQTIRESGAKQFQIILQEGQCKAAMTGYARLCGLNNTNNYHLGVELYQKEWGSNAYFVTDGYIGWRTRTDLDSMVRTGNQMELYTDPFVEYLSGEWKVVDGKGMVYVEDLNSTAEDHLVASPTQWYWVRQSAKAILFQVANSAGQFNGYSEFSVQGSEFKTTEGTSFSGSVNIDSKLQEGSTAVYTSTNLPEGISLNSSTGALSGTVAKTGTYRFTVKYAIDGWVEKSANYTLVVSPKFSYDAESDDLTAAQAGEELFAQITSDVYTTGNYNTVTYSLKSGELPEGVTLSENGELSGAPTTPGTYKFTVGVEAVKVSSSKKGESRTVTNDEFETEIVVLGEAAPEVDPIETAKAELQAKIDKLSGDLAKASTKEEQSAISTQITELQQKLQTLDGNVAAKNTTAPLVLSIISLIVAVAACGAAVFVVLKKH